MHMTLLAWAGMSAWDPLGWVRDMNWYQRLLRADWFSSIRPYWLRYHLDWVVAVLLLFLVLLIIRGILRHLRFSARAQPGDRRSKALALKTAKHYEETGETMMAVQAYEDGDEPEKALELLVSMQAWAQAGVLAEQIGKLEEAADYYERAKDPVSAVRVMTENGLIDQAVALYCREDRVVDAAELYVKASRPVEAAELFAQVGLYSKAAILFSEGNELVQAAECLLQAMAETRSGFTEDEAEQMLQGAATLYSEGRIRESADMLKAAAEFEGAAKRYEEVGDRSLAAECYEKEGKLRRAAEVTDDPEKRLLLLEKLRRKGQLVTDLELAEAMTAAGRHDRAAETFKSIGDTAAAIKANLDAGNLADAATMLAERGRHVEAAEVYAESGDLVAAREQYQLADDRASAAEMARRSGLFFDAGEDFFALGQTEQAVDALQRVDERNPYFRQASSLLGQAFFELGDLDMSRRMHCRATADLKLDRENINLFYYMARFLEGTGAEDDLAQAKAIYADILEVNYGFEDVKQRHDQLP
jgi:tetratricopeptide (TPR) repeat protein